MKQIFTLALALIVTMSSAQLKTVSGEKGTKLSTENLQIISAPALMTAENERVANYTFSPSTFHHSMLNKDFSKNFKTGAINEFGIPVSISGKNPNSQKAAAPRTNAIQYLKAVGSALKISDIENEFILTHESKDELGITHITFVQQYKGLPVYGGELKVHGMDNEMDFLNGKNYPTPSIADITPILTAEQSQAIIQSDLGEIKPVKFDKFGLFNADQFKSELVIFFLEGTPYLVYHHSVYKNLIERWEYFVDAKTGEIIHKFANYCKFHNHDSKSTCNHNHDADNEPHQFPNQAANTSFVMDGPQTATATDLLGLSRNLNTYLVTNKYYMIDGARPMFVASSAMPNDPQGSIWTIDAFNTSPENDNFNYDHVSSNNNIWSVPTAVSAHYNGGKAYEYFINVHQRNSINGGGGNIVGLINVSDSDGSSFGNAFWNGQAMFYGNGDGSFKQLARGLDVAGHEMTHGVVQATANLNYQGESGALNESFADVFGTMIDREDWLMGEDVVKPGAFPSGALRNIQDPHNGAATGDFNAGWQPRHVNEKFTGSQDNGGVHINSGIPNYAFFLFANNANVGKNKAEKVYYRALANYLTKSSQFIDARAAIEKATTDLYGNGNELAAAKSAFDAVGIGGGGNTGGGTYETDINQNGGSEFIIATDAEPENLYIIPVGADGTPGNIDILSETNTISKPSIRDNGTELVFVGDDEKIHLIQINYSTGNVSEGTINFQQAISWRNVAISKDGKLIAAVTKNKVNEVVIIDREKNLVKGFELKNPTFTQGVSTGDVLYADALEFDYTGEYLMYDSENEIKSTASGSITYWDISFIKVFDKKSKTWAPDDQISKLFNGLEEGESVGNPTFSKNSPYIIAFDYLKGQDFSILGANVERNEIGQIVEVNEGPGYPSYSVKDNFVVYDRETFSSFDLNRVSLAASKIAGTTTDNTLFTDAKWAIWFSNGNRQLPSDIKILDKTDVVMTLAPNPAKDILTLSVTDGKNKISTVSIYDLKGSKMIEMTNINNGSTELNISNLAPGNYFITSRVNDTLVTKEFVKH